MAKLSSQATLFGLDLTSLWVQTRQLLAQLPLRQAFIRWTRPTVVQWLTSADASTATSAAFLRSNQWLGQGPAGTTLPPAAALLLDSEQVLHRHLHLPLLGAQDLEAAIQLQALTLSPFAPQDLFWAYSTQVALQGGLDVHLVLASRKMVEDACQQAIKSYQLKGQPEVWAPTAHGPMLCLGWGEQTRLQQEHRQRLGLVLIALAVLAFAGLLALTPSLKLREQVVQAMEQTAALTQQTTEITAQRQKLMTQAQELQTLAPLLGQQIDHLSVLAALTRVLPDDTATQSIVIEGMHLRLQGLSRNATHVQQLLGQEPGFQSVRMPSAITRDGNSGQENFVLEADLDPQIFAIWPLPIPAPSPAP